MKTSPQFKAVPQPMAEVMTVIVNTDSKKGRGLFSSLRARPTEQIVRSCMQLLGTRKLDGTGRQMATWLSTVAGYGSLLLDPLFLTIEQAKQVAHIMRATDPQFALKILRSLPDESPAEIMRRALIVLDTAREDEPAISS